MIDVLDNKAIYAKIEALRAERGWSIYELAKRSAISQTAIRRWRDGDVTPSLSLLDAVCSAFGITLIDFLTDEDDMAENRELLELWHGLSSSQQQSLLSLMRSMR